MVAVLAGAFALALSDAACEQQADPASTPPQVAPAPAPQAASPAEAATPAQPTPPATEASANTPQPGSITEEELKQMLVGKAFYLRGGYLDDSLTFNEHGVLSGHSPQGSYTLSMIEIDRVHLTKHKVELEGVRYGLHFLGALPYEDPTAAVDKVRITPKKKILKITIDRELVVKPKKIKETTPAKNAAASPAPAAVPTPEPTDEAEAKAEMAAAPEAERPSDPGSVTTTLSPTHATQVLKDALDKIFAPGMDDRLQASLPGFWKLYYQAAATKTDYRPSDPTVLRQSNVDKKARLLTTFEPKSNQFAQDNGVAGVALYHTVIGIDGKPGEIAVGRPIGFGLDENAVEAIRNAKFEPAVKDGKPVPVLLDLVVQFRIYSKRTEAATAAPSEAADKPAEPSLPGPYSLHQPQ
jgi:outer membrane biosynthesis protein TonB